MTKDEAQQQEPVAEVESDGVLRFKKIDRRYQVGDKLYLSPQRKPLTDEFIYKVVRSKQPYLDERCQAWKSNFAECQYWLNAAQGIKE